MTRPDWIRLFEDAVREHPAPEVDSFRARRRAMLVPLQARVHRRGRLRMARRSIAVGLLAIGLGAAALTWSPFASPPRPSPAITAPLPSWIRIARDTGGPPAEMIADLTGALEVRIIDDAELARILRQTGRTPGVVRTRDAVLLAEDLALEAP